jgi:hypothetical protein
MKTFLSKVLPIVFGLMLLVSACAPAATPTPTPEPQPEFGKLYDPNYQVTGFDAQGDVTILKGYTFKWNNEGLQHVNEDMEVFTTILFDDYPVLCLSVLNHEFAAATGAPDCRTSDIIGPDAGEVVVTTPQEIFAAMGLKVVYPAKLKNDGAFLAIFSDAAGNPISGGSIRSDFLMLNRETSELYTADGIVDQYPHGAESVCISLNEGKTTDGLRECMPFNEGE